MVVSGCGQTRWHQGPCALLLAMAARSSTDLSEQIPQLLIFSTEAMNSRSDSVATRAWLTLEATIKVRAGDCGSLSVS